MKKYVKPEVEVVEIEVINFLAASDDIVDIPVGGETEEFD